MTAVQVVVWSCWTAFVLIAVAVSAVQTRRLRHRERGMRAWPHVAAVVVGYRAVGDAFNPGAAEPSSISHYQYFGPDGQAYRGKTAQPRISPPAIGQQLIVCVNPEKPAESYPVEKTSRVMLGCLFVVLAGACIGSFFFVRALTG